MQLLSTLLMLLFILPQNGPILPGVPYLLSTTAARQPNTDTLTVDCPISDNTPAGSSYVAVVAWTATSITPLANVSAEGWTALSTTYTDSAALAIYAKEFDASGSVTFISTAPCRKFEAYVGLWTNISLAQTSSVTRTNLGIDHPVGPAFVTAANSLVLSVWMSPDTPAVFNVLPGTVVSYSGVSRSPTGGAGLTVGYSINPVGVTAEIGAQSLNADTMLPYFANGLGILQVFKPQ